MVRGLDIFKEHFGKFADNYIIIGGTACDLIIEEDVYDLPASLKTDMQEFSNSIKDDLPDKAIFKEMGLGNIESEDVYHQIISSFQLTRHQ